MKFKQYPDGSCDLEFSKEEIQIINKKEKLYFSDVMFRHFGNELVSMVTTWNEKFNEETKNKMTFKNTKIEGK